MAAKVFSLFFSLLLGGEQIIHGCHILPCKDANEKHLVIDGHLNVSKPEGISIGLTIEKHRYPFGQTSSPPSPKTIPSSPPHSHDSPSGSECLTSITSACDKQEVCSGSVIFQDDFDTLDTDKWQVHQYIPFDDYGNPFVSYQLSSVSVKNGFLLVEPKLLEDTPPFTHDSVYTEALNLSDGCTVAESCYAEPAGGIVLPPVVSGKITSKNFAFTYGIVKIRAKLPIGDWLYPELHLEPLMKKYGRRNHVSGIIKIAAALGNLNAFSTYNNKVLYSNLIASSKCRDVFRFQKKTGFSSSNWGDDFHDFELEWRPEEITFKVDGEEWASVAGPLRHLLKSCDLPIYAVDAPDMAPFDQKFFISLSVGAGGTTEFPDGIFSTGHRKPWRNAGVKAQYDFWKDIRHWSRTWHKAQLVIDYVKVTAL